MIDKKAMIRLFGGAAVAGTLMLSVACGGSSGGSGGSGSTSSTQSGGPQGGQGNGGSDAMAAYRQCMQKQGVTMPSGGPGGGGGNGDVRPSGRPSGMPSMSAAQQKAAQACASLRPQGGGFGGQRGGASQQPGS
jgi:hypothetical protein